DRAPPGAAERLQERLLLGRRRLRAGQRLVWREVEVRPVALDLPLEGEEGSAAVPVAQLLLEQLGAQILHQLVAVDPGLAAAEPGVAKRTAQLTHDVTQRRLPAEDGHLLVCHAGPARDRNAGVGPQSLAEIGEGSRLDG